MRNYKRRTISLCIASLITVIGAFGADMYDNQLMMLSIKNDNPASIDVTAYTDKQYNKGINILKKNENTHIIILPNVINKAKEPNIVNCPNIKNVNIETFPHTNEKQGYTQITIETNDSSQLKMHTALFIPDSKYTKPTQSSYWDTLDNSTTKTNTKTNQSSYWDVLDKSTPKTNTTATTIPKPKTEDFSKATKNSEVAQTEQPLQKKARNKTKKVNTLNTNNEPIMVILVSSLLLMIIGFIILIGKDKMSSIVGDQEHIDLNPDENDKTATLQKEKKDVKKETINKNAVTKIKAENNSIIAPFKTEDTPEVHNNIINLDQLFNEQNNDLTELSEDSLDTEDDLAALLNEFSSAEEISIEEDVKEDLFDENLYNEIITDKKLKFTSEDIEKLNNLLKAEISEDIQNSLTDYLKEKLTKPKPLTQEQILEDLISTYAIKQNILFDSKDIETIKNLMNVEISKDFITDLRTNKKRVKEAEKEIQAPKENKTRKSEILTLKVKDLLPNLSEELKKQGNKKIEPNTKQEVVYYSEGYEYQKLSVSDSELLDISHALNSKEATQHKDSYYPDIAENGYEVSTLNIKNELPDLEDVRKNPQKYQQKIDKPNVDENKLLRSISNVSLKPFYEETKEEISELNQFEPADNNIINEIKPDNNILIINKPKTNERKTKINIDAQNLLNLIKEQKESQKLKEQAVSKTTDVLDTKEETPLTTKQKIEQNVDNDIIKTILINKNAECSLVKTDDGYDVIGYVNDVKFNLKHYNSLKSTNMQIRAQENNKQYLIKLGIHKFIINITEDNMEFVMDLC